MDYQMELLWSEQLIILGVISRNFWHYPSNHLSLTFRIFWSIHSAIRRSYYRVVIPMMSSDYHLKLLWGYHFELWGVNSWNSYGVFRQKFLCLSFKITMVGIFGVIGHNFRKYQLEFLTVDYQLEVLEVLIQLEIWMWLTIESFWAYKLMSLGYWLV